MGDYHKAEETPDGFPGRVYPSLEDLDALKRAADLRMANGGRSPASVLASKFDNERSALEDTIEAAARDTLRAPSQAQIDAGNYPKGRFRWNGLEVVFENPAGSTRRGVTKGGKPWETELKDHYGYIRQHVSEADGDHVDVFVMYPPNALSDTVFIINQVDPATGRFDEHKVVLCANDRQEACRVYHRNYQSGWAGFDSVTSMHVDQFREWLDAGVRKKRAQEVPGEA